MRVSQTYADWLHILQSSLISRVLYGAEEAKQSGTSTTSSESFSARRQTKHAGVTLWPVAMKARTSDGTDVNLLVLDVQDFDTMGPEKGKNSCLFALGMLLSSFIVYQSQGGVTEEEISKLWSFVSATNKNMQIVPSNDRDRVDAEINISDLTPKLLWVLHGFSLTRDDNGRQMTARQYLERALQEADTALQPGGLAKQSSAKTTLRQVFADRDCFPFMPYTPFMHSACHEQSGPLKTPSSPSPRAPSVTGTPGGGDSSSIAPIMRSAEERARAQVSAPRDRFMHNAVC